MNKFSKLSKDVPATETDFSVQVEGETTKKQFTGDFTVKIPRRKEQCLIDKHRAFLNGERPEQLEASTLRFHHMIAYLRYTITESPKWWKESDLGYELYDENVVKSIYDKMLAFEVDWLKEVWGEEVINKRLEAQGEDKDGDEKPAPEKGA